MFLTIEVDKQEAYSVCTTIRSIKTENQPHSLTNPIFVSTHYHNHEKFSHHLINRFRKEERFPERIVKGINEYIHNNIYSSLDLSLDEKQKLRFFHIQFYEEEKIF